MWYLVLTNFVTTPGRHHRSRGWDLWCDIFKTNVDSESLPELPWGCGFMKIFLCYCLEALTGQSLLKYARQLAQHEHEN